MKVNGDKESLTRHSFRENEPWVKNDITQMPLGQGGVPTVQDTRSFVLLLVTEGRPIVPFSPRSQDGVSSGREATVETLLALEIRCTE